jgi:hypothetical protein
MTQLEIIKEVAKQKGYKSEEKSDRIGFCKKNTWHSFYFINENIVWFDHSYSCMTGKTKKGLLHGIKIEKIFT